MRWQRSVRYTWPRHRLPHMQPASEAWTDFFSDFRESGSVGRLEVVRSKGLCSPGNFRNWVCELSGPASVEAKVSAVMRAECQSAVQAQLERLKQKERKAE